MTEQSEFMGAPRRTWWENKLYVIRDVWTRPLSRWTEPLSDKSAWPRLVRCEYAVSNPNGSKRWLPCAEGVEFAAIQPLRVRSAWR